jgi:hypothetical protein
VTDINSLAREQMTRESAITPAASPDWSMLQRLGFRFLCIFVLLAVGETYDPWIVLPVVGAPLSSVLDTPLTKAAGLLAVHLFHLSGIAATSHPTDSRDTALGWITILLIFVVSMLGTVLWGILDHRRGNDRIAAVWMRYGLRLALVFIMLRYGIFKIFPLQMSRPSLAVLNEPLGQSSPMTLLWTLVGLNPVYQIASGLLEAGCGLLLFFRRTALVGALLGIVVMTNVVLLNFCFDVPVKLGALLILFALFVLVWPDLRPLYDFFLSHTSSRLESAWRPMWKTRVALRAAIVAEISYVLMTLYFLLPATYRQAMLESANRRAPSPLSGEWRVDSAKRVVNGQTIDAPVLTAEGAPMTALFLEPDGRAMARSADGRLWRGGATIDTSRHTLSVYSGYFDGTRFNETYTYSQTSATQLQLTPAGDAKAEASTLLLSRVPLPATYPLLQTRFKWIQEWALER